MFEKKIKKHQLSYFEAPITHETTKKVCQMEFVCKDYEDSKLGRFLCVLIALVTKNIMNKNHF